jgi:hypothetical protein
MCRVKRKVTLASLDNNTCHRYSICLFSNIMIEQLNISNFGGLEDVAVQLGPINIFIGEQASGKSVTAKLFYFFKGLPDEVVKSTVAGKTWPAIEKKMVERFESYFPSEAWPVRPFQIRYKLGEEYIEVSSRARRIKIKYSDSFKAHFASCRRLISNDRKSFASTDILASYKPSPEFSKKYYLSVADTFGPVAKNNQVFIPAARSFFASIQSTIFSLLSGNRKLDPFILEFGSFYERFNSLAIRNLDDAGSGKRNLFSKEVRALISAIVNARISREEDRIYLTHTDGRKVELPFASSGQQETLPLSLMLGFMSRISYVSGGTTIYIEEPEAHLFPSAQKQMVELIATVYNQSPGDLQFVVTTHSPYILTSFNNLTHAGLLRDNQVNNERLYDVVPESQIISPKDVKAYAMHRGGVKNLIDNKTRLISAKILDSVSQEIAVQFDELIDL